VEFGVPSVESGDRRQNAEMSHLRGSASSVPRGGLGGRRTDQAKAMVIWF